MRRPDRREFLGLVAAGGATFTVIGGVLATGSLNDDEVGDAEIETTDAGCGSPDGESASIDIRDDVLEVTGALKAANPCHEASLVHLSQDDETLELTVDAVSTLDDDEVCVECVGEISYRALIPIDSASVPNTVIVTHEDGEQFEFDPVE